MIQPVCVAGTVESVVSYIYAIDLGGWIPKSVVARANLDQPLHLLDLRRALDRHLEATFSTSVSVNSFN
jgi:hypothetical protein